MVTEVETQPLKWPNNSANNTKDLSQQLTTYDSCKEKILQIDPYYYRMDQDAYLEKQLDFIEAEN